MAMFCLRRERWRFAAAVASFLRDSEAADDMAEEEDEARHFVRPPTSPKSPFTVRLLSDRDYAPLVDHHVCARLAGVRPERDV